MCSLQAALASLDHMRSPPSLRGARHPVAGPVTGRIAPALRSLGLAEPVDHVVGDVTDRDCVERALDGCGAVVNAAAVYSLDSRAYPEIARTNVRGAETVLNAAVWHGCDPVLLVSSFVALLQRRATVTADPRCRRRGGCMCSRRSRPRPWLAACRTMEHR